MGDYGHELQFGTFLTPLSARPDDVVRLAEITERSGLDLVTFMDHPYQPAFLDTWTLLAYVAARTERVHLSGYVLNLPSRPPAVLARAAASLDRLSSGRVELCLGPGDTYAAGAVAANGGARRTAGQSVTALSEAIDIVRGIWDTSAPGGVTVNGDHYHVHDAERGPQPAHDISIWVPAGGPRLRRLVGMKADGWIAGGAWLSDLDAVTAGNRLVDQAASDAGRDPRAVRRIWDFRGTFGPSRGSAGSVAGPADQWVDHLLPLALDHGMSTFILITDDPAAIARYGDEVAPALRLAVARERGTATAA